MVQGVLSLPPRGQAISPTLPAVPVRGEILH